MDDDGLKRSAVLLMTLGEEGASEVFKHLAPREVQRLGQTMAALKNVNREEIETALARLRNDTGEQSPLAIAPAEYLRNVLTRALGEDRAATIVDRLVIEGDTGGIERLKWMDAGAVAELIKDEHPQIVAAILAHLDREQASEVLGLFTGPLRNDVIMRIATLDGIQASALRELNDVMSKLLSGNGGNQSRKNSIGGIRTAAEILNFMSSSLEGTVIEKVQEADPDLAQKIVDEMFVFENIMDMDDRAMQTVLRETQSETLIMALKGATPELRTKVFRNMSQRAAEMLREELESKGLVRVSEVEAQQKEILKTVRRLADEGEIQLGGKGDNAYV